MSNNVDPFIGRILFETYKITEFIAKGAHGRVYLARHGTINRLTAIKIIEFLPTDSEQHRENIRRRWEQEVRCQGTLDHHHIVTIHDTRQMENPECFVIIMRHYPRSLASLINTQELDLNFITRILKQICLALNFSHEKKMLHRDVKPANILLDDYNDAYLGDFGIVRFIGETSQLTRGPMGTPDYMSPEQLAESEDLEPQSDVYSVGVVLYEMLTGQLPEKIATDSAWKIDLSKFSTTYKHKILSHYDLKLCDAILEILAKATAYWPKDRYESAGALAAAFVEAVEKHRLGPPPPSSANLKDYFNPYKGLEAFTEDARDQENFFGRDRLLEKAIERIANSLDQKQPRLLTIIGASGLGKSSFVQAGLIPLLKAGKIHGSKQWRYHERLTPAQAIHDDRFDPEGRALRVLSKDLATKSPAAEEKLYQVVFIDQFEEIFTSKEITPEQCDAFLKLIAQAATERDGQVIVILTMRADFLDRLTSRNIDAELGRLVTGSGCAFLMQPMAPEDLRSVIERPANNVGLTIDASLLDKLLDDMHKQSNALPMLQHTLFRLFEENELRDQRRLAQPTYKAIGGISGALTGHANMIYDNLPSNIHRLQARRLFVELVNIVKDKEGNREAVRLRRPLSDITLVKSATEDIRDEVIDAFSSGRLITRGDKNTVEVSHEALIREWDKLDEWLDKDYGDIELRDKLRAGADEWDNNQRDAGFLIPDVKLAEASAWLDRNSSAQPLIKEYIEAAQLKHENAVKWRNRWPIIIAVLILLFIFTPLLIAYLSTRQTTQRYEVYIATSERNRVESLSTLEAVRTSNTENVGCVLSVTLPREIEILRQEELGDFQQVVANSPLMLPAQSAVWFVGKTASPSPNWIVQFDFEGQRQFGLLQGKEGIKPPANCFPPIWELPKTIFTPLETTVLNEIGLSAWHKLGFKGQNIRVGILGSRFSADLGQVLEAWQENGIGFVLSGPQAGDEMAWLTSDTPELRRRIPQDDVTVLSLLAVTAPDATFVLDRTSMLPEEFGAAVDRLLAADVDIIFSTQTALTSFTREQIAAIIAKADSQNVLWINTAGDFGTGYFTAPYRPSSSQIGAYNIFADPNRTSFEPSLMVAVDPRSDPSVALSWQPTQGNPSQASPFSLFLYGTSDLDSEPFILTADGEISAPGLPGVAFVPSQAPSISNILTQNRDRDKQSIASQGFPSTNKPDGIWEQNLIFLQIRVPDGLARTGTPFELVMRNTLPAQYDPYLVRSLDPVVLPPADLSEVLTIGAYAPETGDLAWYTSRSNGLQASDFGVIKPDLVTYGDIQLADGTSHSGTVVSAALVTGTAAVLMSQDNDAAMTRRLLINNSKCLEGEGVVGAVGVVLRRLVLLPPNQAGQATAPICGTFAWQSDLGLRNYNRVFTAPRLLLLSPAPGSNSSLSFPVSGKGQVFGLVQGDKKLISGYTVEIGSSDGTWQYLSPQNIPATTPVCAKSTPPDEAGQLMVLATFETQARDNGNYTIRVRLCDTNNQPLQEEKAAITIQN